MKRRMSSACQYESIGTLGDPCGGTTCSEYVAERCRMARIVHKFPSFEDAAEALKSGKVTAMLVPAAYPNAFHFIQDAELMCDRAFIMAIPALVLAGTVQIQPVHADTVYYHPATEPLLKEIRTACVRRVAVISNAASARIVASHPGSHHVAVTNAICARHYRLCVYEVLRLAVQMPWLLFVLQYSQFKRTA